MSQWGYGLTFDDHVDEETSDLDMLDELAKELGVPSFDFPDSPEPAKRALATDNKLSKKLDELSEQEDVTRFALLGAGAMFVGAKIEPRHVALLRVRLESAMTGDLHPEGTMIMVQACQIYSSGKALDIPGPGYVLLLAEGLEGSGIRAPGSYFMDHQGNAMKAPGNKYPEPSWTGKPFGFGRWGNGIWQSDLQMDVLDDIKDKFQIENSVYWGLNDEEVRTKLESGNALNKLLEGYAKGEGVLDEVKGRKREPHKFSFAVAIAVAISNGIAISDTNKRRIEEYLEASKCGLGSQAWLDLRRAIREYRDGFFLPMQDTGLKATMNAMQDEDARYRRLKEQKAKA